MPKRFRPDPAEFDRCVTFLCMKIETLAIRSEMPDTDCTDLEGTLAAMPPLVRDRVKLMLDGTEIQTEYDDPVMAFAARYILKLAQGIWQENPHPVTHSTIGSRSLSRSS
jgi:hypothetical protein